MDVAGQPGRGRALLSSVLMWIVITGALATGASLLGRWHWLPDLAAHFVVHATMGTALAMVGLWWLRRPGWACLAALLCAIGIVRLWPYFPATSVTAATGAELTIFQFNVGERLDTLAILPGWLDARTEAFDVVVLLEVDHDWQSSIAALAQRFPVGTWALRDDPFGVAAFARDPDAEARVESVGAWQLPTVVLTLPAADGRPQLTVLASHAPAPIGADPWSARNDHLDALAELAVRAGVDGEVVLAADLNTTVWSAHYRNLATRADLDSAARGRGLHPTWSPYRLPIALGLSLDHLLVSRGLVAVRQEWLPRISSDHRPIVTTLQAEPAPR